MSFIRLSREILLANKIERKIIVSLKYLDKGKYTGKDDAFRVLDFAYDLIGLAEEFNRKSCKPKIDVEKYKARHGDMMDELEFRFPRGV